MKKLLKRLLLLIPYFRTKFEHVISTLPDDEVIEELDEQLERELNRKDKV